MAITPIAQITCSLNLGLIYSIDYSYTPQNGAAITLFFVNAQGTYTRPTYLQKAQIRIGNASFSMYVVASEIQLSSGRRVMSVEFVDETFQLDNYQVVLTGKGCGTNVFQLGTPVDNRSLAQKQLDALDPVAQQIAEFTEFPDIEYKFNDFLNVLRQKLAVQVDTQFDTTITNTYSGTFRDVLDAWCSFFAISWFVENSVIKIFNPTTLIINLPTQPPDALEYSSLEDIRSTYGKTCYNWFEQQGGEFPLNQTSDDNGPLFVRTETLFPIGYEANLPQNPMDLNQVAAAQFGQPFWFLYNYNLGTTAAQCGWTPVTNGSDTLFRTVQTNLGPDARVATFDQTTFNERFAAYKAYGETTAGRWYLSNEKDSLAVDQGYQWFDESNGQIFDFTDVDDKAINLTYLAPTNDGTNVIPGTPINSFYSGINYVGNRMAYEDNIVNATSFSLTPAQTAMVNSTFQSLFEAQGDESLNYSAIGGYPNVFIAYPAITIPQDLTTLFNGVPALTTGFRPRFVSVPLKGVRTADYATLKASQDEPDNVQIVNGSAGGNVTSNTAVIKTLKQGTYTIYYDKYSQCASADSTGPYFQHRFDQRQISPDNTIQFSFTKQAANTYRLNRDFATINALVNNPLLPQLAQPRAFPTKRVSFTVNYFYDVPTNFLTNGLVGLTVSIGDNGVTASYTYSNEVLEVPYPDNQFAAYEQQIRNSAVRHYTPTSVIL